MEEKNDKPLLVPENCPPVDYLIIGFTKTDAIAIVLCGVIGVVLGISIYASNGNSIMGVAVFFLFVIVSISIFRRNQYTENLIDKLRIIQEYRRAQKTYAYDYKNIWEMEQKKGDVKNRRKISS